MTRQDEQRLIQQAAAGDRGAAEELIRRHQRSLYAYMLRISGRPEVAEDIVQEAFVRALTNLDRFDFRYRFSTWLFTIARRLHLNACQRLKPVYDTDNVDRAGARGQDEPAQHADRRDHASHARVALDRALARLSSDQREIIVLFHQLDWPIALIARHMDMPEGTIKSHLHRGRRRLRVLLADEKRALVDLAASPSVATETLAKGAGA